jgi:Flp pilus assembly pilin Flp
MDAELIESRPLRARQRGERGQGLAEYALILGLIAIVVVGVLAALGNTVRTELYDNIACSIGNATNTQVPDNC